MTVADITLPEVRVYNKSAKFFRRGDGDYIEISFIGAKDTFVEKVQPSHMAEFRNEWNAYCDGRPVERREGIALTELSGLDSARAENYIARNVHTLEELAALSDAQCQGIGHGALTDRQGARRLITQRQIESREKMQRAVNEANATVGPRPVESYAQSAAVESIKDEIAELKQSIGHLAGLVASREPKSKPRSAAKTATRRREVG